MINCELIIVQRVVLLFFFVSAYKIYPISLTKISEITYAVSQGLSKIRLNKELLVFSVTPFNLDQNKIIVINRSVDEANLRKERK